MWSRVDQQLHKAQSTNQCYRLKTKTEMSFLLQKPWLSSVSFVADFCLSSRKKDGGTEDQNTHDAAVLLAMWFGQQMKCVVDRATNQHASR